MILVDVNVFVYAHRTDLPNHVAFRTWVEELINRDEAYGYSELVLSEIVRVATHPRVFSPPSDLASALAFCETIRRQPNAVSISPGQNHWRIFQKLCETSGAKGNLVADAYLAALAIESGSEWVTTDRDYSRFPGLRWRHPLENKLN